MPAQKPGLPETPRKPVTDEYHGVKVTDNYRWLEDFNDPVVRQWSEYQNRYARALLDRIPSRSAIHKRLLDLNRVAPATYTFLSYSGGKLFAMKREPLRQQPFLIMLHSPEEPGAGRVIVDPNNLDATGVQTIDFYTPSRDGRLVAVSLSSRGSEDGTLHIFETATGKCLPDKIPRITYPTAGGSVAWNREGTGFYYTRFPRPGERPKEDLLFYQQVWFHKLGTTVERDVYCIGKAFPRIAEITLTTSENGRYLLATVANGDGGEYAHYLRGASGKWTRITEFADKVVAARFGAGQTLYLLSRHGAPRGKILRLPLRTPELKRAEEVVHESGAVIERFTPAATRLYVIDQIGGPSQIRVFDQQGRQRKPVPVNPVSSVLQMLPVNGDEILFCAMSYTEPLAWYRFRPTEGKPLRTALSQKASADFSDVEVVREFAKSKDGTRIPIDVLQRKADKRDRRRPTLLTGYGGYGISLRPYFSADRRIWLDEGGVYAVAHTRGGGEFGEAWHEAGKLTKKQNVFDDFVASAEHLIEAGYTSPSRLAIIGGSNGGLLMGAALTQRPELFRAVVSTVGLYDMLRVELHPNGAFNVTEFGTVKIPEQFSALYAYSPYHRVVDGTAYPAVLFATGEHDGRVDPAQSRKMTARLQAATSSGRPVLLRTSSTSGHGVGTAWNERIAQGADIYAFLLDQLGAGR